MPVILVWLLRNPFIAATAACGVIILALGAWILVLRTDLAEAKAEREKQAAQTVIANERLEDCKIGRQTMSRVNDQNVTELDKIRADAQRSTDELARELARVRAEKPKVIRVKEKIDVAPLNCTGVTEHGRNYLEWLRERHRDGGAASPPGDNRNPPGKAASPGKPVDLLTGARRALGRGH